MNSLSARVWSVQEPPSDFAERTVEEMLAVTPIPRSRPRRRFVLYLAMAAVFATGTALALMRSSLQARLAPETTDFVPMSAASYSLRVRSIAAGPLVSALPSASSTQRRVTPSSPVRPAKPAPSNRDPVRLRQPACECERGFSDFICDCY